MAGLQTLMQRGQMPGQAGSFSALPAQQGRNPVAYTRALKQTPPEELIRIYNDPNDLRPKWAVASAYADAMKAKALQQGAQGQQAMAQNASAQQQPPVADEVMTRMAASGGVMKSYADGGAIGFATAGSVDSFTVLQRLAEDVEKAERASVAADQVLQRYGSIQRQQDPDGFERAKQAAIQAQKALDDARKAFRLGPTMTAGVPQARTTPVTDAAQTPPAATPSNTIPTAEASSAQTSSPTAETYKVRQLPDNTERPLPNNQGLAALADSGLTPYARRLEADYKKLMDIRAKQGEVSPEIKAARGRLEQMRTGHLEKAREDSEKIWKEGVRQLQRRFDDVKRPLLEDPEALLALAASIDTTKGKVLGSLSAGGAKLLGERRARTEKAEEAFAALNDKIRLLNSQYMDAQALEEQRKLAILTNDAEGKRNAELAMAQLAVDMRKNQADIDYRMRSVDVEREKARAASDSTAATREGTAVNRLTLALGERQKVYQDAKEEWLKSMPVRLASMKASGADAKPEDVARWNQMQQEFERNFRNSPDIQQQDAAIAKLRELAGVRGPTEWRMREVPAQPSTTGPQ